MNKLKQIVDAYSLSVRDFLPTTSSFLNRREEWVNKLYHDKFVPFQNALMNAPTIEVVSSDFAKAVVSLSSQTVVSETQLKGLQDSLKAFCPWKKGPFDLFGVDIDSEWRSDIKWQRLLDHGMDLKNKAVCDIGANNGYFLLRMADLDPRFVIGLEPYQKHWFAFMILNKYFAQPHLFMEPYGFEFLDYFPKHFDTIFCLGILYHCSDPIDCLKKMNFALKKGGEIYIDCMGIQGDQPVSYVPSGKYAGASGVWNLPTKSCLENWFRRCGFSKIELIYGGALTSKEQRTSTWAEVKSLGDFLCKETSQTIEGHPLPWRYYYRIRR